jgi:hypothetical protein
LGGFPQAKGERRRETAGYCFMGDMLFYAGNGAGSVPSLLIK